MWPPPLKWHTATYYITTDATNTIKQHISNDRCKLTFKTHKQATQTYKQTCFCLPLGYSCSIHLLPSALLNNIVLEYGVRAPVFYGTGYGLRFSTEIYGSKREKTVFHENPQETCFVLT